MYRPKAFAVDELEALHAAMRARVLATLAVIHDGQVRFAYAPLVVDAHGPLGRLRFHLARNNPVVDILDGARATVSLLGPDGYVSPDWYAAEGFVPTWNYVAIEGEGVARRLIGAEREQALTDLSAQEEAKLAPKPPWTLDKLSAAKRAQLLEAIVAFALPLSRLEGTFKLSQDKSPADRDGVLSAMDAREAAGARGLARMMRRGAP